MIRTTAGLALLALLLAGCTTTTTIHRDDQGRICEITQPRKSLVEVPGEIAIDSREQKELGFLSAFGIGLGSRIGGTVMGD